jgi:hypothetical protein
VAAHWTTRQWKLKNTAKSFSWSPRFAPILCPFLTILGVHQQCKRGRFLGIYNSDSDHWAPIFLDSNADCERESPRRVRKGISHPIKLIDYSYMYRPDVQAASPCFATKICCKMFWTWSRVLRECCRLFSTFFWDFDASLSLRHSRDLLQPPLRKNRFARTRRSQSRLDETC